MDLHETPAIDHEAMVGFGPKTAWLAVRDGQLHSVLAALALGDLGDASWRHGVDLAYLTDDRLALTPPLPGAQDSLWLLVFGHWLLSHRSIVEVGDLSAKLHTDVQFFASHRVTELHRWERAADGVLVRSFEFLGTTGETTRWHGEPDEVERSVGLPLAPDDESGLVVAERDVLTVAGAWSLNPSTLAGRPAPGPLRMATAG